MLLIYFIIIIIIINNIFLVLIKNITFINISFINFFDFYNISLKKKIKYMFKSNSNTYKLKLWYYKFNLLFCRQYYYYHVFGQDFLILINLFN